MQWRRRKQWVIISHLCWELGTLALSLPFLLSYLDRFRLISLEHQPRDKSTWGQSPLWADMHPMSEHKKRDQIITSFLLIIKDSEREKTFWLIVWCFYWANSMVQPWAHMPLCRGCHVCRNQGGLQGCTVGLPDTSGTVVTGIQPVEHTDVWDGQRWGMLFRQPLSPKQSPCLVRMQKSGGTQNRTQVIFSIIRSISLCQMLLSVRPLYL